MSTTEHALSTLSAALALAEEHGIPVFPCRPDKRPYTKNGFKDSTTNIAAIDSWWAEYPDALIGVPTGRASCIDVIDIDPEGLGWYTENADKLAAARVHRTRRNGFHLLYRDPVAEIRNSASAIANGVDVRGEGGYVIWWPAYGYEAVGDIEDITEPPTWLLEQLVRPEPPENRDTPAADGTARIRKGSRNDRLSREAFRLRKQGMEPAQILDMLKTFNAVICDPPLEDAELEAIAAGKAKIVPDVTASGDTSECVSGSDATREVIQLTAGQLHVYADASERLLADSVYVRGQRLARLGLAPELTKELAKALARNPDQRVIVPVNTEWLRRTLNTRAGYQKYSRVRKQWEPTDCPTDLVRNIAEAGDWKHFRPLEGIATAPFLRADGTVCDTPGYDPAARVFYAPNAAYSPQPAAPTRNDANAAAERLLAPFAQFPFASDDARAGFLAHVLASVARHAIDTRPVLVYSAPLVACGKTLLAGMASRIADGVEPAERPYSDDSEEMRKVLMSALLAADSTIMLDNVPNGSKVRSPILCGFATAPVYSDRKLGVSESPALTNRCTVILTGNNITPASDLARRCIVVRLDVQAETARGRDFRIPDLKAYIREHRPSLLVDALTIIRAHVLAGSPTKLRPLESFERWSRFARDPVAWLGYGDAVATQELETEDELAPLREAFALLSRHPRFGGKDSFAARDLAAVCEQHILGEDLRAAIEAAGCGDASSPIKIGYWLREHRDRVAAGRKLVRAGTPHGVTQWELKAV